MKWVTFLLGLILAAIVAASIWAWREYQAFLVTPLTVDPSGSNLQVVPGTSYRRLVRQLQREGVTHADWQWRVLARRLPEANQLKAGEFHVTAGTKPVELIRQLAAGQVVQYTQTIIEGKSFRELLAEIREHPQLANTLDDETDTEIMKLIESDWNHPEGAFLPETYRFPKGTTDVDFLRRAHRALVAELDAAWHARQADLPLKSAYEALILASIIEKETGRADERERIAGVFVRRLHKGMRLQTDPTVIYGMGADYDGNIRKRDLLTDTPYNTYTRFGLTPTPIAMASGASIRAAVNPADGDELFFVALGDGSGRHHFSATLAEHERAVDRYQRGIR